MDGAGFDDESLVLVAVPNPVGKRTERPRSPMQDASISESPLDGEFSDVKRKRVILGNAKIKWREAHLERRRSLEDNRLHFVNRERAVEQLFTVHRETYARSVDGDGGEWEVALCANDYYAGKSTFARKYISLLSQSPPKRRELEVFSVLQRAVTIHIKLMFPQPDTSETLSSQIVTLIKNEISSKVIEAVDFSTFPEGLIFFMAELVKRSDRAIFLVIDEVAKPFIETSDRSETVQADQLRAFKNFARISVSELLPIKGLFLLLCGRAPFLDWVGTRPNDRTLVDAVKARRIVLNMLRPEGIVEILDNTTFKSKIGDDMILSKFLNLVGRKKKLTDEYAENLYQVCAGHPRAIAEILLMRCMQIDESFVPPAKRPEFVTENEDTLSSSALELLKETALKFPKSTQRLLKQCGENRADLKLTDQVDGHTYKHLLPPLRISVEEFEDGSIQLKVPDRIRSLLEALVS